ncbi:hypothetical protein OsI_16287 [Oryza sativa Indica Group]|uniref:Uncharacterized protein n=2 Tax=Oryza sativa TaxID=4530 RepID=B9FMC3_ORYSJ|nr:hypothetical protein OsI_16287 [Oryza sativa Indica Group]EEE62262.1 hypothetical protein OsJ_17049 [Oryza sativa Japonica Group]
MAVAGAMVMSGALLLLHLLAFTCVACNGGSELPPISRRSFPKGFIFGTSSSSYQLFRWNMSNVNTMDDVVLI